MVPLVPYGTVWSLLVKYGDVWSYMVLYWPVLFCFVVFGRLWFYMRYQISHDSIIKLEKTKKVLDNTIYHDIRYLLIDVIPPDGQLYPCAPFVHLIIFGVVFVFGSVYF